MPGGESTTAVPPGMCLTHGSYLGPTCPRCSTAIPDGGPFESAEDVGEPLVCLTMTQEAADSFSAALGYGASVAEFLAEANPGLREKISQHAAWLRWGQTRTKRASDA